MHKNHTLGSFFAYFPVETRPARMAVMLLFLIAMPLYTAHGAELNVVGDIEAIGLVLDSGDLLQLPGNPVEVASLGIGFSPRSVVVSGRYAYVVDGGSDDLKVIDVSNPSAPSPRRHPAQITVEVA